jgi:glycosyltransferase involved in cell wall biosynthesis
MMYRLVLFTGIVFLALYQSIYLNRIVSNKDYIEQFHSLHQFPTQQRILKVFKFDFINWPQPVEMIYPSSHLHSNVTSIHGKRILMIGHMLRATGGEVFLLNLAHMLRDFGAEVFFLFPFSRTEKTVFESFYSLHNSFRCLFLESKLWKLLSFETFDIIIANTAYIEGIFAFFSKFNTFQNESQMNNIYSKLLIWIHEFYSEVYALNIPLMKNAKQVVFCSDASRVSWIGKDPTILSNSKVIWPAVSKKIEGFLHSNYEEHADDKICQMREQILQRVKTCDDLVILHAGSVTRSKGVLELLDSFFMFSKAIQHRRGFSVFLILVGPMDSTKGRVMRQIKKTNEMISLQGLPSKILYFRQTNDMLKFYRVSDIVVLNSKAETFGMVLIEAMFAGIPVISRDCGGPSEFIINGSNGFLIPSFNGNHNVKDLAKLLSELISKNNWRQQLRMMGKQGNEYVTKRYTQLQFASRVENLLSSF